MPKTLKSVLGERSERDKPSLHQSDNYVGAEVARSNGLHRGFREGQSSSYLSSLFGIC